MQSTVETLSPTRVKLSIEVPFAELEPSLKKAYRTLAQQISIPGFRKGKVPAAVIDQRVGRGAVLSEAVQEALPEQYMAAVQAHEVKTIGRPEIDVEELADGEPLKFTAEVDVRPELTLPDFSGISVTVDELELTDEQVDEQVNSLRDRFATLKGVDRAVADGDYVTLDLNATVDGKDVEGGSASGISHEVGSGQLLPGLDEAVVGLSADESTTFTTALVAGEFAGRDADVAVTIKGVKEKELPELDDEFAQMASEFDTLAELRDDLRTRLTRVKRMEQLMAARDKAIDALIEAVEVPAPESVVAEEVEHRKHSMLEQLERVGATLEEYLKAEDQTEEGLTAELTESATKAVRIQLLLDAIAEDKDVQVSDDEFGQEIVHRAQQSGVAPQQYYDQLVRAGVAGSVFGDVRRGKALAQVVENIKITDTTGAELKVDDLRGTVAAEADAE
ncbi:trigger factor [Longispora fulva]|uniref:Trigger factor n=1 Tax=Longispora fulva TaxID=619741 RepID=A0A8J7GYR6_9ACTN|nr:trigger factor [Longispora fulva]MBG6140761.1 trigger factor [Longispora fulva]GIG60975.1 trigger factor [Longispora fulva]